MNNRCINDLPINILKGCFSLKEISIFVLPDTFVYKGKYLNSWKSILSENLNKIFKRHKNNLNITLESFSIKTNEYKKENIVLELSKLLDLLISLLIKDIIVFIKINNYNYQYGYLIIPGEQILKSRI